MIRLTLALTLALPACGPMPAVNLCKYADARRTVYTSTITAADAYVASGRPAPAELLLGRQAAVLSLSMLDRNCPVVVAGT